MKSHLVSLFVDMPVCCTRAEPWLESLVPCLINSVCGVPDILFTRQLCIPRMQRHTIYILFTRQLCITRMERHPPWNMVAAPHPTTAATKMKEEGERWAEEDKNGRAPFWVPTPTLLPSQMGPAEKLGWLGALTRNQSGKYSEKYSAKSWSLYSVLVKSWQRKRHQENYIFGNVIDAKRSNTNQNDTLHCTGEKSQMDVGINTKRPKREETDV